MILSDSEIVQARLEHLLDIEPFDLHNIQPASYELHIEGHLYLPLGKLVLASTLEVITLSSHLAAQIGGCSTDARKGVQVHQTAGWVDPGFSGTLTLELYNVGPEPLWYAEGDRIAQVVFLRLGRPAGRPCGSPGLGSRYQFQSGTTAPRERQS